VLCSSAHICTLCVKRKRPSFVCHFRFFLEVRKFNFKFNFKFKFNQNSLQMPPRRRSYARRRAPARRYSRPAYRRRRSSVRAAPRRAPRQARSVAASCVCPGEMSPGAKFALAQLDPYHVDAMGAKIPDSNTQPSISTTDIEQVAINSTAVALDITAVAFRPQYTWGTVAATSAPGAVTWVAAYGGGVNRSKRTAYSAAIELTRPVAHAIRISSPVPPTTASGFVHIALSTESNQGETTWQYPRSVSEISGCQFYKRVTLASLTQSPLTVINKWIDDTAFRYSKPTANLDNAGPSTFHTDYSWAAIIVLLEGVPTGTTVISAEHLLISEGIPQKDSPIVGSQAAASSPGTMSATSAMQTSTEPFHTEEQQQSYVQQGANALLNGAAGAGEAIVQQVVLPVLQHVGANVVNGVALTAYRRAMGLGGISGVNSNPNRISN